MRVCRDHYPALSLPSSALELRFTLQFETNAALDEFRTETAGKKSVDFWPALLSPGQLEPPRDGRR